MMCPNCHSTHVQKNNYARKARVQPLVLLLEVQRAGAVLRLVLRLEQQLDWLQVQLAQLLAVLQVVY